MAKRALYDDLSSGLRRSTDLEAAETLSSVSTPRSYNYAPLTPDFTAPVGLESTPSSPFLFPSSPYPTATTPLPLGTAPVPSSPFFPPSPYPAPPQSPAPSTPSPIVDTTSNASQPSSDQPDNPHLYTPAPSSSPTKPPSPTAPPSTTQPQTRSPISPPPTRPDPASQPAPERSSLPLRERTTITPHQTFATFMNNNPNTSSPSLEFFDMPSEARSLSIPPVTYSQSAVASPLPLGEDESPTSATPSRFDTPQSSTPSQHTQPLVDPHGHETVAQSDQGALATTQTALAPSEGSSELVVGEDDTLNITPLLNIPQKEAAKKVGIPVSTFSKRWKEATGGKVWPFRLISKLDKEIMTLLHNIPRPSNLALPSTETPPMPPRIAQELARLLRERQNLLAPVVIRLGGRRARKKNSSNHG